MLTYPTVLIDLDGTLVDSAPGIVSTIAFTLKEMGKEVPPMKDLLRWVGPPLPESFRTRGHMADHEADEAVRVYRARYLDVGVYDAKLFEGVAGLLVGLKNAGAHLAIATSKPTTPATIATVPEGETLVIQDRGRTERLALSEVLYFKAEQKYVTVRTATRSFIMDGSLSELETRYGTRFMRIHRNALVARRALRALEKHYDPEEGEGWAVRLQGSTEVLSVSRRQVAAVREELAR